MNLLKQGDVLYSKPPTLMMVVIMEKEKKRKG